MFEESTFMFIKGFQVYFFVCLKFNRDFLVLILLKIACGRWGQVS